MVPRAIVLSVVLGLFGLSAYASRWYAAPAASVYDDPAVVQHSISGRIGSFETPQADASPLPPSIATDARPIAPDVRPIDSDAVAVLSARDPANESSDHAAVAPTPVSSSRSADADGTDASGCSIAVSALGLCDPALRPRR